MSEFNPIEKSRNTPPVAVGEIISHAFENYKNALLYALLIFTGSFILSQIFSSVIAPLSGFDEEILLEVMQDAMRGKPANFNEIPGSNMYVLLSWFVGLLLFPLNVGFMYIIHKFNTGQQVTFSDVTIGYRQNTGNIILYYILTSILITIGLFLCFLPGVALAVLFFLGIPIVFFENKSAVEAIKKSFEVSKPHFWTLFAAIILGVLITLSGILLCGIGIMLSGMFIYAVMYSAYCAVCGTPYEIKN
jgi:hypothetical protein